MNDTPAQITFDQWDRRYALLGAAGLDEPSYGGPLRRHLTDGDTRLAHLRYDNSPAALRLWNFLLTEEDRLRAARADGAKIVGAMKDLGTVPVMAYSLDNVASFYPDGAWWIPCMMELSAGLLDIADSMGIDESFCPVRAMLGAFVTGEHFPRPDLLTCSVGATCDDLSAIAQRIEAMGAEILWWEAPHRRRPEGDETPVKLPGGFIAPQRQVSFVRSQLQMIADALSQLTGETLDSSALAGGIEAANRIRSVLRELRQLAYTADPCPMGALEMLIAEMLAIHFCSDRAECELVLKELLTEVRRRVDAGLGVSQPGAARVFWINPVADLRVMNLLEECGGRICGTEYLFAHALDEIPTDIEPMEALAQMALADPMTGPSSDRAARICDDIRKSGAEAAVISRISGASHCAMEGTVIADTIRREIGAAVLEIEIPPLSDSMRSTLKTRLEALVEIVKQRRG
ncbi:MAG: 2-hydroxyacyl-CoA dehydratase family protein [Phycisphaerae bacterium]|jgi:benzoyl-CoA reductase/2-hydroxyglutaryl-CoA dehydratase subunit BcrC/BadD/HgdB|nr:2-hydroxyacyl-CoA dehydratase family protein [Phycisphaerae bacterium]